MAIVIDAQGNLVDTEGRINFLNTGTEQVFPNQDINQYMPEQTSKAQLESALGPGFFPERGIDTLRFVDNNSTSLQPNYLLPNTNKVPQLPANRLEGLDLNRFEGIGTLGVAEEDDVEQIDYLGSKPNKFQEGIAKLFEFYQRFSPVAAIGRGIESIRDRINTRKAIERNIRSDPQGKITTYNLRSPSQIAQDKIDDRGRGQIPSRTTSAPKRSFSSNYSEAQKARKF